MINPTLLYQRNYLDVFCLLDNYLRSFLYKLGLISQTFELCDSSKICSCNFRAFKTVHTLLHVAGKSYKVTEYLLLIIGFCVSFASPYFSSPFSFFVCFISLFLCIFISGENKAVYFLWTY